MTDAEIIKAFTEIVEFCRKCGNLTKELDVLGAVLDLINRIQAENDNLKNDELPKCKDALRRANEIGIELQAEIERLKKGWKADVIETENIKSEAIKEFAERLKAKEVVLYDDSPYGDYYDSYSAVYISDINNLVKEMVGDAE